MHWKRGLPGNWLHKWQEAIDSFDKNKFDICLLDIMMPVKDGFTVAKKIRQQSDVIPILFISTKH
jgi:DNA-binding response OmpR family regulator